MTALPITTVLKPGESYCCALSSRTDVTVWAGAVALEGPMGWLAETPQCPRTLLHAGQSYRPASSGWVRMRAMPGDEAVVCTVERPNALTRLWRWCRGRKKTRAAVGGV